MRHQIAVIAGLLLAGTPHAGMASEYKLFDLGLSNGQAAGVNNSGQIVGWSYMGDPLAVFWSNSASAPVYLATAASLYSEAVAINASGQIAGGEQLGFTQGYNYEGAFWNNSSSTASPLVSSYWGAAYGINDSGMLVGFINGDGGAVYDERAAFWYRSSSVVFYDLGTLGGDTSQANGINASGQIVGYADITNGAQHAAFWSNFYTGAIDLGALGGVASQANGINASGQIVGYADITNGAQHAAFWARGAGAALDLGTLGGAASQGDAINTSGQIVGYADIAGGVKHAAVWNNSASAAVDLNSLIQNNPGWVLTEATAINDYGEIVGYGTNPQGDQDGFALIPLPVLHISLSAPGAALVWWASPAGLYTLQTNASLSAGAWVAYGGSITNKSGTNNVVLTPLPGHLFLRLYQPNLQ